MEVTDNRKFKGEDIHRILENAKGKTLGEVDRSRQFDRTKENPKITGIAGDVVEQSIFGFERDSRQECDIEIDGVLTELKTTGLRIPKSDLKKVKNLVGKAYNQYLRAKEGISVTNMTFEPDIQREFFKSHFWEKLQRLLIVFYEYKSYVPVPAFEYSKFPIIDYCYTTFSETEQKQLQNDWEIVRDYLHNIYDKYEYQERRYESLIGFTHVLRKDLLLIELVPALKKRSESSYQKPRYRLKKSFVDHIVNTHFNEKRAKEEISLAKPFYSFKELEQRCHQLTKDYKGHTFAQLKAELNISADVNVKNFGALCVLAMFGENHGRLNRISDFTKAGIIAKTITITPEWNRTEDMKLDSIDFDEWANRDTDFEESEICSYFCEHSFLLPIFCEHDMGDGNQTTFEGFKRLTFDDDFIENEVKRTWADSRRLIHTNALEWVYEYDNDGQKRMNKSGSYKGAPNFPKSSEYTIFIRGGANDSSEKSKTEYVNGIKMVPQFFWIKGSYITQKMKQLNYL